MKIVEMGFGDKIMAPPITLLRHCGASQVYLLEDAMEVRMRVFRADNRAWKMLKWALPCVLKAVMAYEGMTQKVVTAYSCRVWSNEENSRLAPYMTFMIK